MEKFGLIAITAGAIVSGAAYIKTKKEDSCVASNILYAGTYICFGAIIMGTAFVILKL